MKEIVYRLRNTFPKSEIRIVIHFSDNHLRIETTKDGEDSNYEYTSDELSLISEYVKTLKNPSINKLIISISDKGVSEEKSFDLDYYFQSKRGFLSILAENMEQKKELTKEEYKEFIEIARLAVQKTNLHDLIKEPGNLFLTVNSCQLVTDVPPNFVKEDYIYLVTVQKEDLESDDFKERIFEKIQEYFKSIIH